MRPLLDQTLARLKTNAETQLAEAFAASVGTSSETPRVRAFAQFEKTGLPTKRLESWHYTDMRAAMREAWPAATASANAPAGEAADGVSRGAMSAILDDPDSPLLAKLCPETGADDPMVALNTAMARDGFVLRVEPGANIGKPLVQAFGAGEPGPRADFSRHLVLVGEDASLALLEHHSSGDRVQRNNVLVVNVAAGARVEHVFIAENHAADSHVATLIVELGAGASFTSTAVVADGRFLRRQIFARLNGENAKIALRGVSLLKGKQHVDTTLVVDHAVPRGESRELFKHIVTGEATGVFQGKALVRPHAQKTDGGMKSQALLLSEDAAMYNKPELEIFADDVVCGHGATIGQIDDDQLFYLMSRGIPRQEAESLLIEAFAREPIDLIENGELRARCEATLASWLEARA